MFRQVMCEQCNDYRTKYIPISVPNIPMTAPMIYSNEQMKYKGVIDHNFFCDIVTKFIFEFIFDGDPLPPTEFIKNITIDATQNVRVPIGYKCTNKNESDALRTIVGKCEHDYYQIEDFNEFGFQDNKLFVTVNAVEQYSHVVCYVSIKNNNDVCSLTNNIENKIDISTQHELCNYSTVYHWIDIMNFLDLKTAICLRKTCKYFRNKIFDTVYEQIRKKENEYYFRSFPKIIKSEASKLISCNVHLIGNMLDQNLRITKLKAKIKNTK